MKILIKVLHRLVVRGTSDVYKQSSFEPQLAITLDFFNRHETEKLYSQLLINLHNKYVQE